ncbi:MAG: hypothetical protein WCF68_01105 [Terriglobales bacterium]
MTAPTSTKRHHGNERTARSVVSALTKTTSRRFYATHNVPQSKAVGSKGNDRISEGELKPLHPLQLDEVMEMPRTCGVPNIRVFGVLIVLSFGSFQ